MKKFKIIIVLLLCCAVALSAACSEGGDGTDNNTTAASPGSSDDGSPDAQAENDPDAPDLPAADMGGRIFTFLTGNWGEEGDLSHDISAEELTGDPIDDAAYYRRIKLEQKYNVTIRTVNVYGPTETLD